MGRSQETYSKKEKEKKRLKKRQDKLAKKEERKANSNKGKGLDSMLAYVDENGQIRDTPVDISEKEEINAEDIQLGVPKRVEEEVETERKGKVAFFDDSKGYGFIRESNSENKYFVHVSGLIDDIMENDSVVFELEQGQKGMNAVRVKKV